MPDEALFAAADGNIWDVTSAGTATSLASGFSSDRWQWAQFDDSGGGARVGLVAVDQRLGPLAIVVEAGRGHRRLDLLDGPLAFADPELELGDSGVQGVGGSLSPPLIVSESQIHEMFGKLAEVLRQTA